MIRIRPAGSRFDRLFRWLGHTPLRELFAFQWLLVGRRAPQDPASGADLIP
jgi:hypothetical protein